MNNKIKNFLIGILFVIVCGFGIAYFSADDVKASSTYVGNSTVTYETVRINGSTVAVFECGNDIEVVKL